LTQECSGRCINPMPLQRDSLFKTQLCKFHAADRCTRGELCLFAHGPSELRSLPHDGDARAVTAADLRVSNPSLPQIHPEGQPGQTQERGQVSAKWHLELVKLVRLSMCSDRLHPRQHTVQAPPEPPVRNKFTRQSASDGTCGTQARLTEHHPTGGPPPHVGGECNQDMCPMMTFGQVTFPQNRQETQTTLPSYHEGLQDTQTSLDTYHEEEEETKTMSDGLTRVLRLEDHSSWQEEEAEEETGMKCATLPSLRQRDCHWQRSGGFDVRPGCLADCVVCRFGAHL